VKPWASRGALLIGLAACGWAAPPAAGTLAEQINAELERLAAQPSLGSWEKSFPHERVEAAHYLTEPDAYQ
jgi:hypothetical protein